MNEQTDDNEAALLELLEHSKPGTELRDLRFAWEEMPQQMLDEDRKSTRLNSSH